MSKTTIILMIIIAQLTFADANVDYNEDDSRFSKVIITMTKFNVRDE